MARLKVKCPKCSCSFYGPDESKMNVLSLKETARKAGNIACRATAIAGAFALYPVNHHLGHILLHGNGEAANDMFGKLGETKYGIKCPRCGTIFNR